MSDSTNPSSTSSAPTSGGQEYTPIGSGTNSEGNHWCTRRSDSGGHEYHYSNTDGSYYYLNPNGSKYYNSGKSYSKYTPPGGS